MDSALIKKDYAYYSVAIPPVKDSSGLTPERLWPLTEGIARVKQVQVERSTFDCTVLTDTFRVGSTICAFKLIVSEPASTLAFIMLL